VAEINIKSITDQLSSLMYEFPFRVPAYYALIIRSLVTLEGIAINVDPNFKVLSKAYPYVAKRLLTDPAPQLRASLQDLLFKDGQFRWNRLENLLTNARSSADYDINLVLDQTLEFLFSERGAFIREKIADEIVKGIDTAGQTAIEQTKARIAAWVGLKLDSPVSATLAPPTQPSSLEHVGRIVNLLKDTPGFEPMQLLPLIPRILAKPETQMLGQQIIGGLAQRVAARMIRDLLLNDRYSHPGEVNPEQPRLPAGVV
jgi:hypothetical protein